MKIGFCVATGVFVGREVVLGFGIGVGEINLSLSASVVWAVGEMASNIDIDVEVAEEVGILVEKAVWAGVMVAVKSRVTCSENEFR